MFEPATPLSLRWEGAFLTHHSLAHVNRELCVRLADTPGIELSLTPVGPEDLSVLNHPRAALLRDRYFQALRPPVVAEVRHQFPPSLEPAEEGHLVLMQPWEFGALPEAWLPAVQEHVREVWCYSSTVEQVYRDAGIPPDRLRRIPLGVDPRVFHLNAPQYRFTHEPGTARLTGEPRFIFLYVGGTIQRKGVDVLLDAYLRAFSAFDPVLLVIKDTGADTVYRHGNARMRILELTRDATRPPIVYLDQELSPHALAGLYTRADCLVQPYRGEGFCLPALEAMACGRPVVVTAGGPTDDFVDETVGWRIPASRTPLPSGRVGDWECCGPPWLLEPCVDELARQMRALVSQPAEGRARGAAGAKRARETWNWDRAADAVRDGIVALAGEKPALWEPAPVPPRPSRSRISLTMIVKNEERVLSDCLRSVAPWVDEMVVVDTGSTDRTVEIAESFGARVFHFQWCNSFAAARNESLRHATGDWIFWVDGDDTLPFDSGIAIREAVLKAPPHVNGFIIPVQFLDDGTASGGARTDHLKLFRNLPGLEWEFHIHEQIIASLRQHQGEFARCPAVVMHTNYDTSSEGQAAKRRRDEPLLRLDLREQPQHPFILFNWGMSLQSWGDHGKAVKALRKSLHYAKPGDQIRRKAHIFLAGSLEQLQQREEAWEVLAEGLVDFPEDPELLFHAGRLAMLQEDFAVARDLFCRTVQAPSQPYLGGHAPNLQGHKGWFNLGAAHANLGEYDEARTCWLRSMEDNPQELLAPIALFRCALDNGDLPTAEAMLAQVRAAPGGAAEASRLAIRMGQARAAVRLEPVLQSAVQADPGAVSPRLQLARWLLERGRTEEAVPHLETLAGHGVAEGAFLLGVRCNQQGEYESALYWMQRALELNPDHEPTRQQVHRLSALVRDGDPDGPFPKD